MRDNSPVFSPPGPSDVVEGYDAPDTETSQSLPLVTLTYGTLPPKETFTAHFESAFADQPLVITHGGASKPGQYRPEGSYSCRELYRELERLTMSEDDEALEWASSILSVLGFEWV